jgi:ADP-ribose pyrophosphatase YjhB (NUDIX family)
LFVTAEIVAAAEAVLGRPETRSMRYEILPEELAMIRASQRHGRAHDVTTVLFHQQEVVCIAKPRFPPNVFRIPGGGLNPGEGLAAGARREAQEETGLRFEPRRYLLPVAVRFTCAAESLVWTTHVVSGPVDRLPLAPIDRHEIPEARWLTWEELLGPVATRMIASARPLFAYRVALHQVIWPLVAEIDPAVRGDNRKQVRSTRTCFDSAYRCTRDSLLP